VSLLSASKVKTKLDMSRLVWIETEYAWYILEEASMQYEEIYRDFITPRYITQKVIQAVTANPLLDYNEFVQDFVEDVDSLGRPFIEGDLRMSVCYTNIFL
jgi:hypothetical protein